MCLKKFVFRYGYFNPVLQEAYNYGYATITNGTRHNLEKNCWKLLFDFTIKNIQIKQVS